MRRAAKRDANEQAVTKALEACGAVIARLSGPGVPDLLVCHHGHLWLVEVKDGAKWKSRQQLTPEQKKFHEAWAQAPLRIVRSVDEALALLNDGARDRPPGA